MAGSGSDLIWQTSSAPLHGAIGDINTMLVRPDSLDMAQDMIIDTSGVLRNRGSIQTATSDTFSSLGILGMAQLPLNALTNAGTILVTNDASNNLFLYGTSAAALTGFAKLTSGCTGNVSVSQALLATSTPSPSFARLADDRGFIIGLTGISSTFVNWSYPLIWGGNAVTTSDTTAGTAASTVGSKSIAGVGTAWTSALVGCYLFIGAGSAARLVGQVDQVTSTTAITLRKGALQTVGAAAPAFKTSRSLMYNVYKGRITTNTASAVVVGSNTKWTTCGPGGSGTAWMTSAFMFRYSDGAYVGTVSSVNNDATITLAASAAIALVNEEYYIVNTQISNIYTLSSGRSGGAFTAGCVEIYADRYWYGNIAAADESIKSTGLYYNSNVTAPYVASNSLAFTKKGDPEALDFDPASGDILKLPTGTSSDSIRAMCATRGGLVIFRLNDAFLMTGYSPDTFRVIKLADDGIFYNNSFKPYGDGVIWAGRKGLWYFDGTKVIDLLAGTVKRFYRRISANAASAFTTRGVGVSIISDHVLFSMNITSFPVTWPYKNTTKTMNQCTMVLNMSNGAISFFTNLFAVNAMINGDGAGLLVGWDGTNSTIINGDKIFNESATGSDNFDALTGVATFSSGQQIGPDAMFETTKITMGDATRLKFFKRFLMNYSADVSMTATIIGTNLTGIDFPNISTGTVSSDTFAVSSGIGILHRLRFLVRTPAVAIRVYQTSTTTATSQRFKCLWWALGGKKMRQGRVQP